MAVWLIKILFKHESLQGIQLVWSRLLITMSSFLLFVLSVLMLHVLLEIRGSIMLKCWQCYFCITTHQLSLLVCLQWKINYGNFQSLLCIFNLKSHFLSMLSKHRIRETWEGRIFSFFALVNSYEQAFVSRMSCKSARVQTPNLRRIFLS